jgi:hypothetical protein
MPLRSDLKALIAALNSSLEELKVLRLRANLGERFGAAKAECGRIDPIVPSQDESSWESNQSDNSRSPKEESRPALTSGRRALQVRVSRVHQPDRLGSRPS